MKACKYSEKKAKSASTTVLAKSPVTDPDDDEVPRLPFDEKFDITTWLDGDPPSMRSKAKCPDTPNSDVVSTVILVGVELAVE